MTTPSRKTGFTGRHRGREAFSGLLLAGKELIAMIGFSYAKGGSANISLVTLQLEDKDGNPIAGEYALDVYLSDAATGIGLTATTASGAVAAGASGTDLGDFTAKKAKRVITDATGKYILSITDTAKTGFYIAATNPSLGTISVSRKLVAADYA